MSISSWRTALKAPRKAILCASIVLWFSALVAVALKVISDDAWKHPRGTWGPHGAGGDFPFFVLDVPANRGLPWKNTTALDIEFVDLLEHNGTLLTYLAGTYELVIALVMVFVVCHFASTEKRINKGWGFTYLVCHLTYVFPLALFIYLTVVHSRSDVFRNPVPVEPGALCAGLCKGGTNPRYGWFSEPGRGIDLESWTCGLGASGLIEDPNGTVKKVCTGELGSRIMMVILTAVGIGLAASMEVDRRRWAKKAHLHRTKNLDGVEFQGATV